VGDLTRAEQECRRRLDADAADHAAMHLLGLVEAERSQTASAERLLRTSIALAPGQAEYRRNLGTLLARLGRLDEAIAELERAVQIDPALAVARLALARVLNQVGRHDVAETHAERLAADDASNADAWSALGIARSGRGRHAAAIEAFRHGVARRPRGTLDRVRLAAEYCAAEQSEAALALVADSERAGLAHPATAQISARALMQLDRYDEAESILLGALRTQPHDEAAHRLLAQLRHVRGDERCDNDLARAASAPGAPPALRLLHGDVLRRTGRLEEAQHVLRGVAEEAGADPGVLASLASVVLESGRTTEAVSLALAAHQARPDDREIAETAVVALLAAGDPRSAVQGIERWRQVDATDQRWITYRADAARQLGESLHEEWCDVARLVRVYDLCPPPPFATMEEFMLALRPALAARHRQARHPLDQSLRNGTQTSRGLVGDQDPAIRAFLSALEEPIASYQSAVGRDPSHPLTARNRGRATLTGCWSVRLARGGYHVNHIHPQGWLSSAFYVEVPETASDPSKRAGWLKFGEPLHPMPGGHITRIVEPRPGRLVLFPSYFWHGTTPIEDRDVRVSIAFDANPSG